MKEALKLALEALEHLQPTALTSFYTIGDRDKAMTAIKEALAPTSTLCEVQDELCSSQEPVAYLVAGPYEKQAFTDINSANSYCNGLNKGFGEAAYSVSLLYTTPPKRPWVGLTDEDTHAIWNKDFRGWIRRDSMEQITLAVASKLKEKNFD